MRALTDREKVALRYNWEYWARKKQLPRLLRRRIVALITGRGFGKTRTGAEWVRRAIEKRPPGSFIMLVGPTWTDVQETMIEGESGLLSCLPYWRKFKYYSSKLKIVFPNGVIVRGFSADSPDRIRGPNITDIWGDEFAAWENEKAFKNCRMCLRSGNKTRMLLTSTPSFSITCDKLFEEAEDPLRPGRIAIVNGTTYENSEHLADDFLEDISVFENTDWGEMEIHGKRLGRRQGALWSSEYIHKVAKDKLPPILKKALFADPAASNTKDSDETGLIVLGQGADKRVYVLGDYSVKGGEPAVYLPAMARAKAEHKLDTIVLERNTGGLTLAHTVRNSGQGWRNVLTIYNTKEKRLRCEPCVPLYQNLMVLHVFDPALPDKLRLLEKQMTTSPIGEKNAPDDRCDALALGIHYFLPGLVNLKLKTKPNGLLEGVARNAA